MSTAELAREAYSKAMEVIAIRNPVIYIFSKSLRIEYHDEHNPVAIAATDGKKIILYRNWLELPSMQDKMIVIVHEIYHMFGLHPYRMTRLVKEYASQGYSEMQLHLLANIAADAKVNYWIMEGIIRGSHKLLNLYDIPREMLQKDDIETIFKYLFDNAEKIQVRVVGVGQDIQDGKKGDENAGGGEGDDEQQGGGKVVVLSEGKIDTEGMDAEEIERAMEKAVVEAILTAKNAGMKLSAVEEQMLDELLKPKIDWRKVIRQDMLIYVRKNAITTWTRLNRKSSLLPGMRYLGKPNVWIFMDVSGSVWGEVKEFLTEMVGLIGEVNTMRLITWDTKVTGEHLLRNVKDLMNIKVKGGGGTAIMPALEKYAKNIKPNDYMIVITDLYIFDEETVMNSGILNGIKARKVLVKSRGSCKKSELEKVFDVVFDLDDKKR